MFVYKTVYDTICVRVHGRWVQSLVQHTYNTLKSMAEYQACVYTVAPQWANCRRDPGFWIEVVAENKGFEVGSSMGRSQSIEEMVQLLMCPPSCIGVYIGTDLRNSAAMIISNHFEISRRTLGRNVRKLTISSAPTLQFYYVDRESGKYFSSLRCFIGSRASSFVLHMTHIVLDSHYSVNSVLYRISINK